ncbi:MAG: tetraacyldisaccharide 4'-kinase [Planctomycetes bacterium]|nr:tetraacyldisaccharide 4'-kinase [Planctomycetota bacterium]
MDQDSYRNLISGESTGFGPGLLRVILRAVSAGYLGAVALRNLCYDRRWLRSHDAGVPVISVGNVTTGGTGKTPLVIWLCKLLAARSVDCAVLTRGYKSESGKFTDEPAILAKSCPDANVIVDGDRVSSAAKAIEKFGAGVLVMDDGFQHRRLRRDLDIVAVDATCPFGFGRILPAGLLREPVSALKRADAVVITRYDQATIVKISELEKAIERIAPQATIARAVHRNPYAKMLKGATLSIDELKEKPVYAFCGIGNPKAFFNRLEGHGLKVMGTRVYNDHHNYTERDIKDIYEEAKYLGAELILSTQKDWVKTTLLSEQDEDILFAYMAVELEFVEGADKIESLVAGAVGLETGCEESGVHDA